LTAGAGASDGPEATPPATPSPPTPIPAYWAGN